MTTSRKNHKTLPPNTSRLCPYCCSLASKTSPLLQRFGYFKRVGRRAPIQRYRCLECKRSCSEATFEDEYRQKKRHLNASLFKSLVSSCGLRQAGRIHGLNYKTVVRRLTYFGIVTSKQNSLVLQQTTPHGGIKKIQFDDMESFEHTRLKPLSIPMTVNEDNRLILSFDVVSMPAKGPLAVLSVKKYGKRPDHRKAGWESTLTSISCYTAQDLIITSDDHTSYPGAIRRHIAHVAHVRTKGRKACVAGFGEMKVGGRDPLFSFNHSAAMYRAHVNRLHRRTWCTTKRPDKLKVHMSLYQFWHNERILAKLHKRCIKLPFAKN